MTLNSINTLGIENAPANDFGCIDMYILLSNVSINIMK